MKKDPEPLTSSSNVTNAAYGELTAHLDRLFPDDLTTLQNPDDASHRATTSARRSRPGAKSAKTAKSTKAHPTPEPELAVTPHQSWGRMPDEPLELYERFLYWLRAPERGEKRSMRATAEAVGRAPATVYEASGRWSWRERALQYDRYVAARAADSAAEQAAKAAREQARLAQRLTDLAAKWIEDADEADQAEEIGQAIERAATAVAILERAQRVQRLALGQSTSNSAHAHRHTIEDATTPDLTRLSAEQRQALRYSLALLGVAHAVPANQLGAARDAHFKLAVADLSSNPPQAPNQ